jgi:hypothetical protein
MHSWWRRAVATVVGLWFTLSVSGVALQLCPLNGMQGMAGMHQTAQDCARSAAHQRDTGSPAQNGGQHNSSHDDCGCTGMCCVAATVTLAAAAVVAAPVVEAEAPPIVAPADTREFAPRAAPDVTLPPPLGPPTLRA